MRKSVLPLLTVSTVLLLQACAKPVTPTPVVYEPADEYGHAALCDVTPNPVPLNGTPAVPSVHVQMSVGNDGGWCAVRMAQVKTGIVRAMPQHGVPYFRNVRDITRLQYTPAAGYAGPDSFTFEVLPAGIRIETSVTVKAPVAPAAALTKPEANLGQTHG